MLRTARQIQRKFAGAPTWSKIYARSSCRNPGIRPLCEQILKFARGGQIAICSQQIAAVLRRTGGLDELFQLVSRLKTALATRNRQRETRRVAWQRKT